MTPEQLAEYLAKGKLYIDVQFQHTGYKEKVELRDKYFKYITGENIKDLLPKHRHETTKALNNRKAMTIENLSPISARVLNYYYKVARTPKNKKVTCKDDSINKKIAAILNSFYDESDIEKYITDTLDILVLLDPNAGFGMAIEPFAEGEDPKPYPLIFDCNEIYDYGKNKDGSLAYMWVKLVTTVYKKDAQGKPTKDTVEVEDYYLMMPGYIYFYQEQNEHRRQDRAGTSETWKSSANKDYKIFLERTGTDAAGVKNRVQTTIVGYLKHKKLKNIYVSPIDSGKSIYQELIERKSGLDNAIGYHVFPQLFMYSDKCPGEIHLGASRKCEGGKIAGTNRDCTVCGGDGLKPVRSAAEYIKIPIPKKTDQSIPIDKYAYYNSPDIKPVEYLDKRLEVLEGKLLLTIFNNDHQQKYNGSSSSESQSATETMLKRDSINNTLKPFADNRGRLYRFAGDMIGIFYDVAVTSVYEYTTEKFEPITFEELIATLKALTDANADSILVDEIQFQLAVLALDNDKDKIKSYTIQRKFLPFRGKTTSQIQSLLASDFVPKFDKILWCNFSTIWEAIEAANQREIYDKDYKVIKKILDKIVEDIQAKTDAETQIEVQGFGTRLNGATQTQPPKPQPTT